MKRWSIIIAVALMAAWLIVIVISDLSTAIQYFSSEPYQLLYVAAIAIAGGFAALGFARLLPRTQRHVRVFAWGAAASTVTAFVGYFGFRLGSLSSLVVESGGSPWALLDLMLFASLSAYLWFVFYRARKSGVSQ